jgi:hypothetical protein
MPSIRDLIQGELDRGKTVRQLEQDSGYRVRFQTFQELSKHAPKQFPKQPETIVGMAVALKVPEVTVVLAYAIGLGIPIKADSSFSRRIPPGVDGLEPPLQDAMIQLMRAALKSGRPRRLIDSVSENEGEELTGPLAPFVQADTGETGEAPGENRREHGQ